MPLVTRSTRASLLWPVCALVAFGCGGSTAQDTPRAEARAEATGSGETGDPGVDGTEAPAALGGPDAPAHASVRLLSDRDGLRPGDTVTLALEFRVDPEWHLYWNGRNDSGLHPMVTWEAPETVTLGELQWPAPERLISPGSILDHVYDDDFLLLVPLTVGPSAQPGEEIAIRGAVTWVACREACFAERGTVDLTLRVQEGAADDRRHPDVAAFERIQAARERLPRPLPDDEKLVFLDRRGDRLEVRVPDVSELSFFPSLDCVDLADAVGDAHAAGDRLDLELDSPAADARLRGVLEVRYDAPRPARYYALDLPVPAPAG